MLHRLAALVLAAVLALAAAGCGDGGGTDGDTATDRGGDWSASTDPVDPAGLVWADQAGVIHLADGSTLDAGTPLASYVVAGDGAYAVPRDADDTLLRVTPDAVTDTGARLAADSLRASPDGRYLLFLDPVSGERPAGDVAVVQAVVVDLQKGEEVVRTSEGMGDPETDDLRDLYEDAAPGTLGVTDDTAWVDAPSGVLSIALPGGDVATDDVDPVFDPTRPWYSPRLDDDLSGGPWNASRTWAIDPREPRDGFVSGDGRRVAVDPGTPTWTLVRWLDDRTAVGFAVDAEPDDGYLDQQAERTLITCTVPDGACRQVPGASGPPGGVLLPQTSLL